MFMELFRGKGRRTWQLRFTDHTGERRQLSTRTQDRSTAITISGKIEQLVIARGRGDEVNAEAIAFIHDGNKFILDALTKWGIITKTTVALGVNITTWLDRWKDDLLSKGNGPEYANACRRKVRDTLQGLDMPQQITALAVDENIKLLRKVGVAQPEGSKRRRKPYTPQSCNDCLAKTKQFCSWLVKQGAMRVNPLVAMQGFTREVVNANRAHPRGVLTLEQQRTLLERTAASSAIRGGMTGQQRADLYRLVLQTGLRAYEAASLRVHWFNLAERTLTLPVDVVKTSREDVIFLRADLIDVIKRNMKGKAITDYLFPHVHEDSLVDLLRDDLAAADIPTITLSQKHIDFYSLRHTYGTEMAKLVKAPVLQQLMRHKSVQTTLKYYVHIDMNDAASAVDLGPALDAAKPMLKAAG